MKKIFLSIMVIGLLFCIYRLYLEYEYEKKFSICPSTQISEQIAQCAEDNRLDDNQKLLYLRSKSDYITGGGALVLYWSYATVAHVSPDEHQNDFKKIIKISKECLSFDSECIYIYISEIKPDNKEVFLLYENYLMSLKDVCESPVYFIEYEKLAKQLNYPVRFKNKCF